MGISGKDFDIRMGDFWKLKKVVKRFPGLLEKIIPRTMRRMTAPFRQQLTSNLKTYGVPKEFYWRRDAAAVYPRGIRFTKAPKKNQMEKYFKMAFFPADFRTANLFEFGFFKTRKPKWGEFLAWQDPKSGKWIWASQTSPGKLSNPRPAWRNAWKYYVTSGAPPARKIFLQEGMAQIKRELRRTFTHR